MINQFFQELDRDFTAANAEADSQDNDSQLSSIVSDMSLLDETETDIDDLAIELSGITLENQRQLAVARSWIAAQQRFLNSEVPSVILNETFFNNLGENVVAAFANLPEAARAIPLIAQILAFCDSDYTPDVVTYVKSRGPNRVGETVTVHYLEGTKTLKACLHDIQGLLISLLSRANIKYSIEEYRNICNTADVKMLVTKPGETFAWKSNRGNLYPMIDTSMAIGGRTVSIRVPIHVLVKLCQLLVKVLTPPHVVNENETNWIRAVLFGILTGNEVRAFLGGESPLEARDLPVISHDSHDPRNIAQLSVVTSRDNCERGLHCAGWVFCPTCRHTMDACCPHTPRCTYVKIARCLGCASA